jgi:hypothetical protein
VPLAFVDSSSSVLATFDSVAENDYGQHLQHKVFHRMLEFVLEVLVAPMAPLN